MLSRTAYLVLAITLHLLAVPIIAMPLTPEDGNTCSNPPWDSTVKNWQKQKVDENLKAYWNGSKDTDGIQWPGAEKKLKRETDKDKDFTRIFGGDLLDLSDNWPCKIGERCTLQNYICTDCGAKADGKKVPSHWGWLAANAMANLCGFLDTLYAAISDSLAHDVALATNAAKTFFPSTQAKSAPKAARETLSTLSSALSLLMLSPFGFLGRLAEPAGTLASKGISATAISSSYISTELQLKLQQLDSTVYKSGDLDKFFEQTVTHIQDGVVSFANKTFQEGSTKDFNVLDVLKGGAWVQADQGDRNELRHSMTKQILSHGINHFWRQEAIFVTFAALDDDDKQSKCKADKNGPQPFKYCGDGGVYYLHRWKTEGSSQGHLVAPWGWKHLNDEEFGITPAWITESSARSYRAQIHNNGDPFNYDSSKKLQSTLYNQVKAGKMNDVVKQAPYMEGTWTLPVCDMGDHPGRNKDWTTDDAARSPPCWCGKNGEKTKAFYEATGIDDCWVPQFCMRFLDSKKNWPPNATKIDFGKNLGHISKKTPEKVRGKCHHG